MTDTIDDDGGPEHNDDERDDDADEAADGGHAGTAPASDATPDDGAGPAQAASDDDGEADVRAYLLKGSLVLLVVLGVVATLQFYLSAQTAIRRMASDEFRPAFVAAFNLVVLLAVGVGIAQVVRRLG
jgi:hypothetical protein